MAKHLKLNIKNTQIAEAIDLGGIKRKLVKKSKEIEEAPENAENVLPKTGVEQEKLSREEDLEKEEAPRIRARSKSVFSESNAGVSKPVEFAEEVEQKPEEIILSPSVEISELTPRKTSEELRRQIFGADVVKELAEGEQKSVEKLSFGTTETSIPAVPPPPLPTAPPKEEKPAIPKVMKVEGGSFAEEKPVQPLPSPRPQKLGPTGQHFKDLYPPRPKPISPAPARPVVKETSSSESRPTAASPAKESGAEESVSDASKKTPKPGTKEFRDVKPLRRQDGRGFDARDRQGLRDTEEDQKWRKKKVKSKMASPEIVIVRPTVLKVRTPISIKDLASEMKLKASELIAKLFLQGLVVTLDTALDDETTIQLLGQEFGCNISIDTSEQERIRITDKTVREEIQQSNPDGLIQRPPVVTFMGHVDHGKTSLIDAIRKSNRAASEAGAITQHIGAFCCQTAVGNLTILDTPGHEAFSAMRARGADVTDIVVLVIAGDEGIRQQTIEAIRHAKTAKVTMVVAINKCDKPNFNAEQIYRQLAEQDLLPEVWGGQVLTVNCSAVTGEGVKELLEMLALQAEILELRANPKTRARGVVLESELHKGMGTVATVLVQNGTLRVGDALVFEQHWGRVKTMRDELGRNILEAPPSTPLEVTGLSGVPDAGQEFIVVQNEREAREIAEVRMQGARQILMQQRRKLTSEVLTQTTAPSNKKVLNVILRADVQGSLEALKTALQKIESLKAELVVIFAGVGEVAESDIQLAATSKAVIIGFHTQIESHAESLMKQLGVQVRLHRIIYHAIDDVKMLMTGLLDKIAQETERGKADVKAVFKSSHVGVIAGCIVTEGVVNRNSHIRVMREGKVVAKAQIASLRRVKEDVREVAKGLECGIALQKFTDICEGDILEAYEITYITQEL